MKTLKRISLAILFCAGTMVSNAMVKTPNSISTEIQENIKLEKQVVTKNERVEVLFTTNQNGDINFVMVKTENKALKGEIEKQFSSFNFKTLKSETVHSIILNIKLI
jgi:hypothetical protein